MLRDLLDEALEAWADAHHRGQLALYARLLGRVPALTRRIQGSE